MPFYSKVTLQRVYRTWNAPKKRRFNVYIQMAYGKSFLKNLQTKSTANLYSSGKRASTEPVSQETIDEKNGKALQRKKLLSTEKERNKEVPLIRSPHVSRQNLRKKTTDKNSEGRPKKNGTSGSEDEAGMPVQRRSQRGKTEGKVEIGNRCSGGRKQHIGVFDERVNLKSRDNLPVPKTGPTAGDISSSTEMTDRDGSADTDNFFEIRKIQPLNTTESYESSDTEEDRGILTSKPESSKKNPFERRSVYRSLVTGHSRGKSGEPPLTDGSVLATTGLGYGKETRHYESQRPFPLRQTARKCFTSRCNTKAGASIYSSSTSHTLAKDVSQQAPDFGAFSAAVGLMSTKFAENQRGGMVASTTAKRDAAKSKANSTVCMRPKESLKNDDIDPPTGRGKQEPRTFESFENVWNLGPVTSIEDVPLLQDDEERKLTSFTETAEGHTTGKSAPKSTLSNRSDGASKRGKKSDDAVDNNDPDILNESVEDGVIVQAEDSPLPGVSQLCLARGETNLISKVSPVFKVIAPLPDTQSSPIIRRRSLRSNKKVVTGDRKTRNLENKGKTSVQHKQTESRDAERDGEQFDKETKEYVDETQKSSQSEDEKGLKSTSLRNKLLHDDEEDEDAVTVEIASSRMKTAGERKVVWTNVTKPTVKHVVATSPDGELNPRVKVQGESLQVHRSLETPISTKWSRSSKQSQKRCRIRGQSGWEDSLRQKPSAVVKFQAGQTTKPPVSNEDASPDVKMKELQYPQITGPPQSPRNEPASSPSTTSFRAVMTPPPPPAKKLKLAVEDGDVATMQDEDTDNAKPVVLQNKFLYGQLVWGKMKGFNWWPGRVTHYHSCKMEPAPRDSCWIRWFGDEKYSKLNLNQVIAFSDFSVFSEQTFLHTALYRRAVFRALLLASKRADKSFLPDPSSYVAEMPRHSKQGAQAWLTFYSLSKEMVAWARGGFEPAGLCGLMPSQDEQQVPSRPSSPPRPPSPAQKATPTKRANRAASKPTVWKDIRDVVMADVRKGDKSIEDICLGCGSSDLTAEHPFFVGGLCEVCRVEFLEVAYVFDDDGYQCFCSICAEGNNIILCDQAECYRSFCYDCLNYLVGPGTVGKAVDMDHWCCLMCHADPAAGLLTRRHDWPHKLLLLFQQDKEQRFPALPSYPPVEIEQRRPIRVLSLFDGIGTGMLVLKELGMKIDCYYASEISVEAMRVSMARHDGTIQQLDDVQHINDQQIQSLGPFDLVIGGSPCNDLSIANPARKGLYEGTGRLFFQFFRLLQAVRPQPESERPFFWLFENVVGMKHKDKMDISMFLQCDPVLVDAKNFSPAHRPRYFWGNLPGMNRPNVVCHNNNLSLQDCLEPNCNRQAQFSKVRTVTTKLNSVRQKSEKYLPVLMNGQEDTLWCTEMERIFGFPEHYTDIANMSRTVRHKLIGQAWSVPVIKHLLAPLKDYYAWETRS